MSHRSPDEVHEEIADMTPEQRGDLIRRIRGYDWPEERKKSAVTFVLLLGLVGEKMPRNGVRRSPN